MPASERKEAAGCSKREGVEVKFIKEKRSI